MTLQDDFREFALWCDGTSALYARLSRGVARDDELLDVAASVPDDQPPPNTLLAAVHALLLDGADHELGQFYPSVRCAEGAQTEHVGTDEGGAADEDADSVEERGDVEVPNPDEDDPVPAFRDFVLGREDCVRELAATRRTQTNSVGRCAALYPALARVADAVDGPLALVEVGSSAGLNLLFDRYRYRYETAAGDRTVGADGTPVQLRSRLRGGDPPLPADPPAIDARVGIDVNPLSVTDDADVNWLRALVWPEHTDRFERLSAALSIAQEDPPRLVEGNALDVLPDVVSGLPDDLPVCVYDTQVLYQFSDGGQDQYRRMLTELAADCDLHWVTGSGVVEDDGDRGMTLRHATVARDGPNPTTVARYESHGRWVRWVA